MTISSTYFREHMAEIIEKVADKGENVILVFGKGKNAKKINLSPLLNPIKENNMTVREYFDSDQFKNRTINNKYKNAQNYKEFKDENLDINDYLA